jgi:uncharacterized OB-fold protein
MPRPDEVSEPYWAAAKRHELHMQRCAGCQRFRFPPQPMCPECHSLESEWRPMSGRGRIFSWVECHPPVLPAFRERAPFLVVLVELDENPLLRVLGNLLDVDRERLAIGQPVQVCFEVLTDEVTLPQWRQLSG